ncbi:hypothetical protein [Pseudooceanicola lipolyticus]|uniref:hypothetical protein n=1 Tax=Pseudooceanicola lipolyticus TaxID=2029104 RepID=UPI0010542A5E|nr:hypothetical protein [Pseudooceanicola lipolyticus]
MLDSRKLSGHCDSGVKPHADVKIYLLQELAPESPDEKYAAVPLPAGRFETDKTTIGSILCCYLKLLRGFSPWMQIKRPR